MSPERFRHPLLIVTRLRRRFIRETEYFLNRRLAPSLRELKRPRIESAAKR
jgi:hypothetical protein